ncbi:mediator of RNA polymerase II transcription subunit 9 [Podarcis raffonei]|uniref:mediator of RNA polymerase II transcription subunit 9 n=1 Tax=Podarcis raffonei TaxID=65483 RepID=UPI0023291B8D|nr:mediator of RNA polymerase II transcription subunit 9 [Podarcis raffonei]
MATPGGTSAVGGSRPDEQPSAPPGAPQAAAPAGEQQAPPPPQQQPSPAEQKFQSPAGQAPPPPGQQQQQGPPQAPGAHPGQEDYSFLPLVHDIIKCMDKDSQDVHQVLNELRTKFVEVRKVVQTMQGISVSPEQQQLQLQSLREQVKTKSELLQKYKSLCMFEIPKD